ncbi:hypothetical protein B9Q03_13525 [Candidatus Marsarchaeota G2 archaeon OSP_D]|jgi:hypothetical protein|uniref:Uncharacterized protein n=1 Tax=Candidatus Marsarchaeota G2 archaeon OSP_D TaxID=1978157 RepID=A0A2R6AAH8_9ARCH|nr:MAG: hypothetical protein B9Q03_13525 [Candidatus Marsarchaeota G2 archaeon OSP_D]
MAHGKMREKIVQMLINNSVYSGRWDKACSDAYKYFRERKEERRYIEKYIAAIVPPNFDPSWLQRENKYEIIGFRTIESTAQQDIYVCRETARFKRHVLLKFKEVEGVCHAITAPFEWFSFDDKYWEKYGNESFIGYYDSECTTYIFEPPDHVYLAEVNGPKNKEKFKKTGKFKVIQVDPREKIYLDVVRIVSIFEPGYRLLYTKLLEK